MPTTIRLSSEIESRLTRLATQTGRTKAFYLRRLIEEHLDDLEDAFLGDLAWEEHKNSGQASIPLNAIKKDLGLDG